MFYDTHPHQHAIGHRRGRHGFGHGGGFGPGFRGGDDMPGARKLSSADLQLVVLALLADGPAHGYELIRTLEERSRGFYAPSPGMIYPALTYLEEIGHASVTQEGNRKQYDITAAGRSHLEANRAQADGILAALDRIGRRMAEVREAYSGLQDADPAMAEELHEARHALKQVLYGKRGCAPEEARRIAAILRRAAEEIGR